MVQSATMTGKPLIESDRVEGTTVYDRQGNNIGSIKRLMIEKLSGRVAYAVMSFGGKVSCRARRRSHGTEVGTGRIAARSENCTITTERPITGASKNYYSRGRRFTLALSRPALVLWGRKGNEMGRKGK
jgi:hypothetical protein